MTGCTMCGLRAAKEKVNSRQKSRQNEDQFAIGTVGWNLLLVTIVAFHFGVLFHIAGLDRLQLQRTGGHHFKVRATLRARDDLALFALFLSPPPLRFSLPTNNHASSS